MGANTGRLERPWVWYAGPLLACILSCSEGGVCGPMDSTSSCCIKTHVFDPARCGLTESEAGAFLTAAAAAEFAKTADLPPWKQECVDNYVACMEESWTGPCYSCLRYCEGQRKWPFETCRPRTHR